MKITDDGKYLRYSTLKDAERAELEIFENYVRMTANNREDKKMYNAEAEKWSDESRISRFPEGRYKVVGQIQGVDNTVSGLTSRYAEVQQHAEYFYIPKPIDELMPDGTHTIITQEEFELIASAEENP